MSTIGSCNKAAAWSKMDWTWSSDMGDVGVSFAVVEDMNVTINSKSRVALARIVGVIVLIVEVTVNDRVSCHFSSNVTTSKVSRKTMGLSAASSRSKDDVMRAQQERCCVRVVVVVGWRRAKDGRSKCDHHSNASTAADDPSLLFSFRTNSPL